MFYDAKQTKMTKFLIVSYLSKNLFAKNFLLEMYNKRNRPG